MIQKPPANADRITGIIAADLLTYAHVYLEHNTLKPPKSYFNPVDFFDYAIDTNINGTTGPMVWLENHGPITTLIWEGDKHITAGTISDTTRIRLTRHMGDTMYTMSFRDEDIISALTNLFFFNTQAPYSQGA